MRAVFMGTPEFAVPALKGLRQNGYEIVCVYTQPDHPSGRGRKVVPSPVKAEALALGLNVRQPVLLKGREEIESLQELRPGLVVVAAYAQILPRTVLDIPPHGCLNIHPSLLPRHRGPSPVAAAIQAGDEVTGVSLMLMDEGLDTGPVLAQRQLPVLNWDTTGSLTEKLADLGAQLLIDMLPPWIDGRVVPQPQDSEKATYSGIIKKEDGRLDWSRPAVELWRKVRAFQPWPGCYTAWEGKLVKIIEAAPLPGQGEVGRVVEIPDRGDIALGVATGDGILGLVVIQIEGKRAMSGEEFLRGQRGFIGSVLAG